MGKETLWMDVTCNRVLFWLLRCFRKGKNESLRCIVFLMEKHFCLCKVSPSFSSSSPHSICCTFSGGCQWQAWEIEGRELYCPESRITQALLLDRCHLETHVTADLQGLSIMQDSICHSVYQAIKEWQENWESKQKQYPCRNKHVIPFYALQKQPQPDLRDLETVKRSRSRNDQEIQKWENF